MNAPMLELTAVLTRLAAGKKKPGAAETAPAHARQIL
jgi:hypothetical protein